MTAGGVNDLSGNGRNGSPVDEDGGGIAMGFSGDVPALIGAGMSLDLTMSADFLRSDTPSYKGIAGGANRTIGLWIKTTGTTNQTMVEWGPNNEGERWTFRLNNSAGNGTVGGIRTEVQSTYVIGGNAVNDNNWHHVAVVFEVAGTPDKADINLYIDGVLETTTRTNTNNPTINTVLDPDVAVGGSNTFANRSVNGLMDDVAIWSRALSAGEVAALAGGAPIESPSAPGDFNGDGIVDRIDVVDIAVAYGSGVANLSVLAETQANFGNESAASPAALPEPSSIALLLIGLTGTTTRFRRRRRTTQAT